ncbi:hypothetical protein FQA39_LY14840 [Lamprigera yunnana]|nr:hypothetical protein FQA39_LY14840 [Lamprigera yunnana]
MSMSPGSILVKLDELKKWQDKQQERLLKKHHQQSNPTLEVSQNELTKIKLSQNNVVTINAKPKQPYLHRGAGLCRFRMQPGEQFRPFHNKNNNSKSKDRLPVNKALTPLSKPNVNVTSKAVWQQPLNDTDHELIIFETLEKRAVNSSFSSTNSSIVRLLSSTPQKNSPKKEGQVTIYTQQMNTQKVYEEPNIMTDYEQRIKNDYLTLVAKTMEFKRYANMTPSSSLSSINEEDTLQPTSYNDEQKWTDLEILTSESSTSSIAPKEEEIKCNVEMITKATMTDDIITDIEFQDKINKLKNEIKTENVKVKKLKEQLEQRTKDFERNKKEMQKYLEEEKAKLNLALEEEKKKYTKEKMVFERYAKDLQNKPNRKEREEISVLKMEVATLQETLKLKETRNGTAQARMRNQIKMLEKENANLKVEVDNLNKQHAKYVVRQKLNGPSNTKMIHEINKNLSKLTQEQFKNIIRSKETNNEAETVKENDKNVNNSLQEEFKRISTNHCDIMKDKEKDRIESILSDGTTQIKYRNGNVKSISSDGNIIIFQYFNGDIKETNLLQGTIRYHYFENKVNHTTNADGSEVIEFPDGQIEKRDKNGGCEISYPNGTIRKLKSNGTEEALYPDGTTTHITNGERIIILPNGQKEIHTDLHKRREYPDGTMKILYPDGVQETRYANGRVRMKDKFGKLIMDLQN